MNKIYLFIIWILLFSKFDSIAQTDIRYYPNLKLTNGLFIEPTYMVLKEKQNGYLQIDHKNNIGQLSDIFQSNIHFIKRLRENQIIGFKTNFDRVGPLIGQYGAKVNYTNFILLNTVWKLGLSGAFGLLYSKYKAPGVSNPNSVLPDADINLILSSKHSYFSAGLNQLLNSKSRITKDINFVLDRFITISGYQKIYSSYDTHLFYFSVNTNIYKHIKNIHRLNFIYKFKESISTSIGYSSSHALFLNGELEVKKSKKISTRVFFAYRKKTFTIGKTFDALNIGVIFKKRI